MAILEVRNLKKRYGAGQVLKGVDFSLEKGEVLAIIGSSGSGKTTLLRCLNSLERPDEGKILVNGEIIFPGKDGEKKEKQVRDAHLLFGLVFQSFNLFPQYTVLKNVMLGLSLLAKNLSDYRKNRKEIRRQIQQSSLELLERVGLKEKRDSYPCELSGGQCQRVAIARALALKPEILCFDEPTSALDPKLTGEVLNVIRGLKSSDRTMIVVTHEMNFARNVADKVIYMADGVIEETGTAEQVFDRPKSRKTTAFFANYNQMKGVS